MRLYLLPLFAALSLQAAVGQKRQAGPSVTIRNGTVVGSSQNGVDSFKGIPYAQPPVGTRRLRAPAPLATGFGTITATVDGQPCPSFGATAGAGPSPTSGPGSAGPEDCLFLNVQRPTGTRAGSNIPVVAYMYGGGFGEGSTRGVEAAPVISVANSLGEPVMVVSFNYRLSGWGFLASSELASEGSTNLGLRDQRLALQWIRDNIGAFGGDPNRVTIWGESAGSFSVMDQMLINGGNNQYGGGPLFRAAMMSSGTILPAFPVSHPRPQGIFNRLVQAANCTSAPNRLDCLRALPFTAFADAQRAAVNGQGSLGFVPYFPRPDPSSSFFSTTPERAVVAGTFARVPTIIGTQEDEGTVFTQGLSLFASSTQRIALLLNAQSPELSVSDATTFVNTYPGAYPDRVTEGSPFYSGLNNEIYTGYKRISAVIGDALFIMSTRISLDSLSSRIPVYSFIATYLRNANPPLGTQHGADTNVIFNGPANHPSIPDKRFRTISFWRYADPNFLGINGNGGQVPANPNYGQWPRYTTSTRQLANFGANGVGLLTDDFRQDSYLEMNRNFSRFST